MNWKNYSKYEKNQILFYVCIGLLIIISTAINILKVLGY